MMYSIRVVDDFTRSLHNEYSDEFVAENRSAALKFASDIANGLLECIEQDLEKRVAEDKSGVAAISDALAALASAGHSPEQ